jgi:mannitol-specific phosphotransferase system IIBC component
VSLDWVLAIKIAMGTRRMEADKVRNSFVNPNLNKVNPSEKSMTKTNRAIRSVLTHHENGETTE